MRKRKLSDNEWTSVQKLKETGASWSKIERETGVPRRTAQRVYKAWQQTQSMPDFKEARRIVVSEAFREHVNSVLRIANFFTSRLDTPKTPYEKRTADKFISDLWQIDILCTIQVDNLNENNEKQMKSVIRTNEILFKALQDHTQQTRIWDVWQQWMEAWNDCILASNNLKQSATTVVENNLNQEAGLLYKLKQVIRKYDPVERLSDAIVCTVWKQVLDKNQIVTDKVVWVTIRNNRYEVAFIDPVFPSKFSNGVIFSLKDQLVAEKVVNVFDKAYLSFVSGIENDTVVKTLKDSILKANNRADTFSQMAHPLLLKPIILRSSCDICPA